MQFGNFVIFCLVFYSKMMKVADAVEKIRLLIMYVKANFTTGRLLVQWWVCLRVHV
jgi:hypothetical protein